MKRVFAVVVAVLLCATVFAKGKKDAGSVLTVGATPEPHAEMLNLVKDDLAKQGITLKVVEFTDYVTPNEALESGQIDANFFQHIPYMDSFNKEKGYHLVNAGGIHVEPVALYSKKISKLSALADGATIAIPNDPTNEGRALLLLQSAGLITLKASAGITATPLDIESNSKKLKFREIEAASLPRILNDVDAAVINGNYAIPAGLSATKDGLIVEGKDSPYVNIISVKAGNENKSAVKALVKALQSQKIKDFVSSRYPDGEVVIVF
ncbi:MAG: MetQ/NlpA family ABC transporter substrate-binding protein [Spirochaetaceae bacterium]|nr:MetQ/NlpA family ABC transporter substrate-binding protein [Spirochaetaceae bacterium]MBP5329715.1 MetQ/NlpA family ABC transporter substrate-binding protein [Spirochaetaceae bacterium]MBP5794132.1 MetQ/NlpA family ABC transporter substrate-binding protein [Spirochaetaceae bacterium]